MGLQLGIMQMRRRLDRRRLRELSRRRRTAMKRKERRAWGSELLLEERRSRVKEMCFVVKGWRDLLARP